MGSNNVWINTETVGGNGFLVDHGALYWLRERLPALGLQKPSLVSFFGTEKEKLIRSLRQGKAFFRSHQRHVCMGKPAVGVKIYLEKDFSINNILLASCEELEHPEAIRWSGPVKRRTLNWFCNTTTRRELDEKVHTRLILPFSDVVCFVCSNLADSTSVAEKIVRWAGSLQLDGSTSLRSVLPRAIVVCLEETNEDFFDQRVAFNYFVSLLHKVIRVPHNIPLAELISTLFTEITVVCMASNKPAIREQFREFQKQLHQNVDSTRIMKAHAKSLINLDNFITFFDKACQWFCEKPQILNIVQASRASNITTSALDQHVSHFLSHAHTEGEWFRFSIPVIASTLVKDSFLYGIHRFSSLATFDSLYKENCNKGILGGMAKFCIEPREALNLGGRALDALQELYQQYSWEIENRSLTPREFHTVTVSPFAPTWRAIYSSVTCFYCLMQKPEYFLPCGHSLCETCVKVLGEPCREDSNNLLMRECSLCSGRLDLYIRLKPPTAGIRILTLDGGGIRGIIELEILRILEKKLDLGLPIQEAFDFVIGTSAGGLIALGLCANQWSVETCTEVFEKLSNKAFIRRRFERLPIVGKIPNYIMSYFTDSLYDTKKFEEALQEAYGPRKLFGRFANAMKLAVTTATSDSYPFLLTNYNGVGTREEDCGYSIIRPERSSMEPTVYEAARCTSAAPLYHKPKFLHFNYFQDGGVIHNNPIRLALWESRVIWPTANEPDVVITIGTGFKKSGTGSKKAESIGCDIGFISRLFQSFMQALDGQQIWRDLRNNLQPENAHRYHRLTYQFSGAEPALDDIQQMQDLKIQTRDQMVRSPILGSAANALLASLFYFALDGLPEFRGNHFQCSGQILCRIPGGTTPFQRLMERITRENAIFHVQGQPITCLTTVGNTNTSGFKRAIDFSTNGLHDPISITLASVGESMSISAFPCSLNWLVSTQGIICPFGWGTWHQTRKRCSGDIKPKKRRRVI